MKPFWDGHERYAQLYLVFADAENTGPGVTRLAKLLQQQIQDSCVVDQGNIQTATNI